MKRFASFLSQFAFALLALCLTTLVTRAAGLEAALDRTSITTNETARLNIVFRDIAPSAVPRPPAVPGLSFAYRGQSQQFTTVNNQASRSTIFTYELQASAPGNYTIPAITGSAQGANYQTGPLALMVTAAPAGKLQMAFLKIVPPSRDVFVSEIFPLEIQLYYVARRAEEIQHPQLKGEGFTIHERLNNPPQTQTTIQGTIFQVVSFRMSASAAKAGELELGPASISMVLRLGQAATRRNNDPFDIFADFDEIFGRYERRQVSLAAEPVKINVLPFPAGAPGTFTGAVGEFKVRTEASSVNVTAGDPITLKVEVEGTGSIDALALPPFKWNNFQVYPPHNRVEKTDQLGMQGKKIFEYAVAPQNPNARAIPPLEFTFLDTRTKKYKTVTAPAIPLTVAPSPNQPVQPAPVTDAQSESDGPRDILHIKSRMGPLIGSAAKPLIPAWIIALQSIPVLLFGAAFIWRKREDSRLARPTLISTKEMLSRRMEATASLRELATSNPSHEFFAALFRLLQEQLGHVLGRPAAGLTEADASSELTRRGATSELISAVQQLFARCDEARFGRVATGGELLKLVEEAEGALTLLEKESQELTAGRQ